MLLTIGTGTVERTVAGTQRDVEEREWIAKLDVGNEVTCVCHYLASLICTPSTTLCCDAQDVDRKISRLYGRHMTETTVLRNIYVPVSIDAKIKQIAWDRHETYSSVAGEFLESGLLAHLVSGERTTRDLIDERQRLDIQFRKDKIAELVKGIDQEFDERWQKVKAAITKVYEGEE
jgi:hypothetical protein